MRRGAGLVVACVLVFGSVAVGSGAEATEATSTAVPQTEPVPFGSDPTETPIQGPYQGLPESVDYPLWVPIPTTSTDVDSQSMLIGDVSGDGRDDAVGFEANQVYLIVGGDVAPEPIATLESSGNAMHGSLADVNGDGVLDLVLGFLGGGVSVFPGGVADGLGTEVIYPTDGVVGLATGDINGDMRDDVVLRTATSRRLRYLIQSASGTLELVSDSGAPMVGSNDFEIALGDVDGNGLVDVVAWPGLEAPNRAGSPHLFTQATLGDWDVPADIDMGEAHLEAGDVYLEDVDENDAAEIFVAVMGNTDADRHSLMFWQDPGGVNVSDSDYFLCRVGGTSFADADGDGRTDFVCRGMAGVLLFRQSSLRGFDLEFYLNDNLHNRNPLLGNVVGDSRLDLITTHWDGFAKIRIHEGRSPGSLTAAAGQISGSFPTSEMCVEAISTHNGRAVAATESAAGSYAMTVPEGMYVIRYADCRPHPRSPAGMSYFGSIRGGSDPLFQKVDAGAHVTLNLNTELQPDLSGQIVDDVTGEPLEGIRVWEGVRDSRVENLYWIANSTMTDSQGRFTKYGSHRQIDLFIDDPLGVYPGHTLYVHDDSGDVGTWGLVDPIMGDIRSSVFVRDILWLRDTGVTRGCNPPTNDMFCTDARVTRAQMAAFLVRFLSLSDSGSKSFVDDDVSIFQAEIEKLATAGITKGCNPPINDRFCPDDFVTRGQMAAFLTRALSLTEQGTADFIDDDGLVFEDAIESLAEAGITKGCNPPINDRFCPNDYVTRGQMAAFLNRASGLRP